MAVKVTHWEYLEREEGKKNDMQIWDQLISGTALPLYSLFRFEKKNDFHSTFPLKYFVWYKFWMKNENFWMKIA